MAIMDNKLPRPLAARIVFIIGLLLMFLGTGFLFGTLEGASRMSVFVAFLFVLIGGALASFAIKLHKRSSYLFFAAFFLMVGLFLFLSALRIIPVAFQHDWPVVSVFAGLAMIPAGWHRYGVIRTRYMVPAVLFVALGAALLIFSLKIVSFSFSQFVLNWWPLIIILAGLILVLLSLSSRSHDVET
jgi:hypothetical protein